MISKCLDIRNIPANHKMMLYFEESEIYYRLYDSTGKCIEELKYL